MDVKFFDSLYEGDSPNGVKLGMGLTGGDFWPRPAKGSIVYRGQDGDIDYDIIQAVMTDGDASVSISLQDLPASTIWHYLRRAFSDCGIESPDSYLCIVVINENGDMIGDTPNGPSDLAIEQLIGGKLRLRWRYNLTDQEIAPTGFNIYVDTGSGFDFDTPVDTLAYVSGKWEFKWDSLALSHGSLYRYIVRSYRTGAGENNNSVIVSAKADSQGPAAITGLVTSWEEN